MAQFTNTGVKMIFPLQKTLEKEATDNYQD